MKDPDKRRELIRKVRKVEIKTKGLTEQIFSGDYHSAFKGQGMSFAEVREYQYGDDVRNIDWNVTARSGTPHIKIYEEERELTVILMVDISPSVFTGMYKSNHELIAELCAILAFSAIQNNDKVGLLMFSDRVELFIPPGKGKKHILRIIRELLERESRSKSTDIGQALQYLNHLIHKRSIVFLMSDFFSREFSKPFNVMSRKHDLIGMHMKNQFESVIPMRGLYQLQDPETNHSVELDLSNNKHRRLWKKHFEDHQSKIKDLFRQHGSELISLSTHEPYVKALHQFFNKRKK